MIPTPQPPPITETMQNNSHGSIYSGFTDLACLTLVKPIECRTRGTKNKNKKKKYNGPTFQWDIITLLFFHLYRCSFLKMSDESSQAAVGRERRWGAAGRRHLGQQSQGGRERELGRGRGRRGPGHADDGAPPHCP